MAAAYECDRCGDYFKDSFKGSWKKTIMHGKKEFVVELKVGKNPHHCKKCWPKFCKLLFDDLKASYK